MKKSKVLICFSVLILLIMSKPALIIKANESNSIKIDTFPKDIFLQLSNLKPGDKIVAPIDVINSGTASFTYKTTAEFTDGSKKYYDVILIEIKDKENQILQSGSLGDFKWLAPRKLEPSSSERLNFKIEIPYELGNEYQGLSASMKIIFIAEGAPNKDNPGDPGNPENPDNPGNPGNPGNPNNPESPEDPDNNDISDKPDEKEDPVKPAHPGDPSNPNNPNDKNSPPIDDSTEVDGDVSNPEKPTNNPTEVTENLLPETATNIYNILLIGLVLLGTGTLLLFYFQKLRSKQ